MDFTIDGVIGVPFFLRIHILIDLEKPLPTGFNNKKINGSLSWIQFKYEKLPDLCFSCERFNHFIKHCSYKDISYDNGENKKPVGYDP